MYFKTANIIYLIPMVQLSASLWQLDTKPSTLMRFGVDQLIIQNYNLLLGTWSTTFFLARTACLGIWLFHTLNESLVKTTCNNFVLFSDLSFLYARNICLDHKLIWFSCLLARKFCNYFNYFRPSRLTHSWTTLITMIILHQRT